MDGVAHLEFAEWEGVEDLPEGLDGGDVFLEHWCESLFVIVARGVGIVVEHPFVWKLKVGR